MNTIIVSCFDTYKERIANVHDYFISRNHTVSIIESNYSHCLKSYKQEDPKRLYIHVIKYKKNLSISRMISHYFFSKKVYYKLIKLQPDVIYALVPPNSLVKSISRYKRRFKNVVLIFDIMDMWPETLPISKLKNTIPFQSWKNLRDKHIANADYIFTECSLFKNYIEKTVSSDKISVLHLTRKSNQTFNAHEFNGILNLCYLGSINNILDIPLFIHIVQKIADHYKVVCHIIGDGEQREKLLDKLQTCDTEVIYYGKIYDIKKKHALMSKCDIGLNIMKESVCVGLTMKSMDYFENGLPLINNIKGDTAEIVNKYNVGLNIKNGDIDVDKLIDIVSNLKKYQQRTYNTFKELFSVQNFQRNMDLAVTRNKLWEDV